MAGVTMLAVLSRSFVKTNLLPNGPDMRKLQRQILAGADATRGTKRSMT
jgi:hypothetical protein